MNKLTLAGLALVCASNDVFAQRTWIVDARRQPGYHFDAIQPAVDAASPGDIVRVRVVGAAYAAPTISKGIALLAEGSIALYSDLVVANLPAGQRVSVRGFRMWEVGNPFGPRPIRCTNCRGTVHFERMQGGGSVHGPALDVEDCVNVSVFDSIVDADGSYGIFLPVTFFVGGNVGVRSLRSSVMLVNSRARGRAEIGPSNRPGFLGSWSGVTCVDSRLVLAGCEVGGGAGACRGPTSFCIPVGAPTAALVARTSIFTYRATTFTPGAYTLGECTLCGPAAPPLDLDAATTEEPAIAHISASGATPGGPLRIVLDSSVAGHSFATFASFPSAVVAFPVGLWIDPVLAVPIVLGVSAVGSRVDQITVPSFLPLGLPIGLQTVFLQGNQVSLSTPAVPILQ